MQWRSRAVGIFALVGKDLVWKAGGAGLCALESSLVVVDVTSIREDLVVFASFAPTEEEEKVCMVE